MELIQENVNGVFVLKLIGRLDASCVSQLKNAVQELIEAKKLKILIDMASVDFVDSSGLGTLVTCMQSVNRFGGAFKISSVQKNPKFLFETTRLDRVFKLFEEREVALNSF